MNYYFVGIGGAGVSALASVLKSQGHQVSGSDDGIFPPVSTYLDQAAIPYFSSYDAANVPSHVDHAIIGTSAKINLADNLEYNLLKKRGVPCDNFATFLGQHTKSRENLLVAGSFGKSSLTAMVAGFLEHNGQDPGWFIGAVPLDLSNTGNWGKDPLLVMEADEYVVSPTDGRSKFELYHPSHLLISSIVHDHLNVFPTVESYEAPFARLIANLPKNGLLVCAHGDPALAKMTEGRDVVWYGAKPCPGYFADNIITGEITHFDLCMPSGDKLALATPLLGLHNVENIVGACAFILERGLMDKASLAAAVLAHRGVARRLDRKLPLGPVPIYEGFGSSYEKARSAIDAMKLHFPTKKLLVVFEPHTFSWRNRDGLVWYDSVFEGAQKILLLPPPNHGAERHDQLTQNDILARIGSTGANVLGFENGTEILAQFAQWQKAKKLDEVVILLLSSGPLDGLAKSLPAQMAAL